LLFQLLALDTTTIPSSGCCWSIASGCIASFSGVEVALSHPPSSVAQEPPNILTSAASCHSIFILTQAISGKQMQFLNFRKLQLTAEVIKLVTQNILLQSQCLAIDLKLDPILKPITRDIKSQAFLATTQSKKRW
jgi:hypothetical protein